jgi:ParB family chromosome partitioning protein
MLYLFSGSVTKGGYSMANFFGANKEKAINKVYDILVTQIFPNPYQPRSVFSDEELRPLADSIKQNGILQPLTVRKMELGYELVSGERRLRAAKMAGLISVPCIMIDVSDRSSALLALVENIQREDLSFFDEAAAIEQLIDLYGMTQEDAAIKLGMAQSTVANKLRLLKLTPPEREKIKKCGLSERHARALLKIKDPDQRLQVVDKIVKHNMNVEKTELFIEQIITTEKEREDFKKRAVLLRDVRLFMNTINKAVETVKMAGIPADSKKIQNKDYIEYVIRIPVNTPNI